MVSPYTWFDDLGDDRLPLGRQDVVADGQEGDADEQDREDHRHRHQRAGRVPRLRRLEGRHARGDRLGAGQGDGARREGPEQDQDRDARGRVLMAAIDLRRSGVGPVSPRTGSGTTPSPIIRKRRAEEQVGRDGEDAARLAEAAQVAQRDQPDGRDADHDLPVVQRRDGRGDLLHGGRRGYRDGQRVVDEQRGGRDQRGEPPEVRLRHRVRAAAGGVRVADLAVAEATIPSRTAIAMLTSIEN